MTQKEKFCKLLLKTKRKNIESVIKNLQKLGFFESPASTKFHGCYDGGLLDHSLNVYEQAIKIFNIEKDISKNLLLDSINENNIIIVSLLHDICKSGMYVKTQKWRKDKDNNWEQYTCYDYNNDNMLPIGHGEKSVIMLFKMGFELTDEEIMAIRWHMSNFDLSDYTQSKMDFNNACNKSGLLSILIAADWLATRITENE